ncbi:hypothetical protein B296_00034899 [Ensete ventricosum]|uniref:Uncharacterized protein n=1 Tax=Ensete ventricosum TaxID=4639 RepID=A0A426YR55_ENSVE|nr:hypothetical protein B296_00034899 [Ensete ventricosum]
MTIAATNVVNLCCCQSLLQHLTRSYNNHRTTPASNPHFSLETEQEKVLVAEQSLQSDCIEPPHSAATSLSASAATT